MLFSSVIRRSGNRFCEKIMRQNKGREMRFDPVGSDRALSSGLNQVHQMIAAARATADGKFRASLS
jgi:hypothetical protein